jgi:hypothetical protein
VTPSASSRDASPETGRGTASFALVAYWYLPLILFGLQTLFTLRTTGQILYEELAESVRNPYWLHHGVIYDPISSNVGWYGTLLALYRSFGFTLHAAKWVRLALALPSLLCVAWLLQRELGRRAAWVPLVAFGLSPSLLVFTSSQTAIGIDLQYAPIVLALLVLVDPRRPPIAALAGCAAWAVAMLAWMSYPVFAAYLPALALIHWSRLRAPGAAASSLGIAVAAAGVGFLAPLLGAFAFVENRATLAAGIFRGGGRAIALDPLTLLATLRANLGDLVHADSYHYRLHEAELSGSWAVLSALFVLGAAAWLALCGRSQRFALRASWLVLLVGLLGPSLSPAVPGLRRVTPALFAFYACFAVVWGESLRGEVGKGGWRRLALGGLLLLPLHHLAVYPANLVHASDPSGWQAEWFQQVPSPSLRLRELTDQARRGLQLSKQDEQGRPIESRYTEVYAAVAGACEWNHLGCQEIQAWDARAGHFRRPADRPPE